MSDRQGRRGRGPALSVLGSAGVLKATLRNLDHKVGATTEGS